MICGGLTLSHHLPRMLMGSEEGLNEWFLWKQLYNLNAWEGEKREEGGLNNKGCCVTNSYACVPEFTYQMLEG